MTAKIIDAKERFLKRWKHKGVQVSATIYEEVDSYQHTMDAYRYLADVYNKDHKIKWADSFTLPPGHELWKWKPTTPNT